MRNTLMKICAAVAIGILGTTAATLPPFEATPAHADTQHTSLVRVTHNEAYGVTKRVTIGLNKATLVELPRQLRDVLVSNPEILDAVVQTSNRVHLIARKIGQANAFFFDENGERMLTLEVSIDQDVGTLDALLNRLVPGANIKSEILNDTVILTGTVPRPADSSRAADIASRFMVTQAPEAPQRANAKVINLLAVEAKEQVMLKVSIAEMNREVIKRLGVNWRGANIGNSSFGYSTENGFPVTNQTTETSTLIGVFGPSGDRSTCFDSLFTAVSIPTAIGGALAANCLTARVQAFERVGLLRTLAEPNLTAISGETASFLAGGEFPVPVGSTDRGTTIEFKPFGVGLSFTPIVMSEGRISLKMATEVSELSSEGAVTVSGPGGTLAIPGLKVRRANTTIELPSGGSLVIAGLLSDDTRQNIDGLPGLKNLPILGTLFRSRDYQKQETELVVIVTPYSVNPVSRQELSRPDDGFMAASDPKANFLGHLNRIYGRTDQIPDGGLKGDYGFIVE